MRGAVQRQALVPTPARVRVGSDRVLRRACLGLLAVWVVLGLGNLTSMVLRFGLHREYALGVSPFLDLSHEQALGTWVAAVLLLTCGLLALGSGLLARRADRPWQRNWYVLAAVLVLISVDEVAAVHDHLTRPLREATGATGLLYFVWVVPVGLLGLAFLVYQLRFLAHLGRTGRDLVVAGVVYVTGAAGFEMAQAVLRDDGGSGSPWDLFPFVEEMLELAGTMLALRVLLAALLHALPQRAQVVLRTPQEAPGRRGDEAVLRVDPDRLLRRVARALLVVWVLLALGGIFNVVMRFGLHHGLVYGLVPLFDLDEEQALGTWVASVLLLSAALVAGACALLARRGDRPWDRHWAVLALVLALLSLDEVGAVHDRVGTGLQRALDTSGVLYRAWVVPAVLLGLVFLAYQARFLVHLGRTGRDLVLAGLVYVSGAVGLEMAQAVLRDDGGSGSTWDVFPVAEELLEFAGVMLAVLVLLRRLLATLPDRSDVEVGR